MGTYWGAESPVSLGDVDVVSDVTTRQASTLWCGDSHLFS
jgi:hypothetical protein